MINRERKEVNRCTLIDNDNEMCITRASIECCVKLVEVIEVMMRHLHESEPKMKVESLKLHAHCIESNSPLHEFASSALPFSR